MVLTASGAVQVGQLKQFRPHLLRISRAQLMLFDFRGHTD